MIVTASTSAPRDAGLKSGVLADVPAANANARPNGHKEKIQGLAGPRGRPMNHCTYDSQHEPKNIKVQGLHGRWDVCLHAIEKNGSREYWWVRNANGVDGEDGYWSTSATRDGETATTPSHTSRRNSPTETRTSQHVRPISGRTPVKRTKHKRQERKKCATTS